MALTAQDLARIKAIRDSKNANAAQAAPVADDYEAPKKQGLMDSFASKVNSAVEGFRGLPVVKQLGQISGAALGGPSALIGGAVGAIGAPIANIAQGKPVFDNYGEQIKANAIRTGKFGYDLGEQVPTLGVMQTLGKVPNLAIGAAQTYEGYNQTKSALARGDTGGAIQAGITTGIGAVGTILGAKQKGLVLDEGFTRGTKAAFKGVPVNELKIQQYEKTMQDVLQPNKSTVKRETKGILSQARKERAGMSVEPRKTTARVLVEEGVVPGTVDDGKSTIFRTADQVVDMDNRVAYVNDELEKALALDPNPQFDLAAKKTEAIKSVDAIQNISSTEKKAMKSEIERFFDDEIETRGQFINGSEYNQVKRGFANAGDYKNLTPGQKHMRQVAESIASDIETRYADKFNVKEVNRTLGDYIQARNELQSLDGSVVKGGGLSRRLAQLGGAVAAGPLSRIPLVDNIVGGYLAGKAQSYAVSPARKLAGLDSANIQSPGVRVIASAQEGSQAAAARQAALPRLPAPRLSIPGALDQYVPSKPGLMTQEQAREALRGTTMDINRVRPIDEVIPVGPPKQQKQPAKVGIPKSGKPPKIDLPTQQEMVDVIDYARLKPGFDQKLEYQASLLAEKYGIKAETLAELANKFEDILFKIKNTNGYQSIRKK